MWKALTDAVVEALRFAVLWHTPESQLRRQRAALSRTRDQLRKERDDLLLLTTPSEVERLRLSVVVAELRRVRDALADLDAGQ